MQCDITVLVTQFLKKTAPKGPTIGEKMNSLILKMVGVLSLSLTLANFASAGSVQYRQDKDRSMLLTINEDGTGSITRQKGSQTQILIAGTIESSVPGSLTLVRPEGDVCPSVQLEMIHDIVFGENAAVEVRNRYEDAGTALRFCQGIQMFDGSYSRVK